MDADEATSRETNEVKFMGHTFSSEKERLEKREGIIASLDEMANSFDRMVEKMDDKVNDEDIQEVLCLPPQSAGAIAAHNRFLRTGIAQFVPLPTLNSQKLLPPLRFFIHILSHRTLDMPPTTMNSEPPSSLNKLFALQQRAPPERL
ncbi:hypothetical protein JHK87_010266 [Glycine soja]|nr:hypothetical protein JHK87_010266 [Glycine soja]